MRLFLVFFKQGANGLLLLSRYGKICMHNAHNFLLFFNDIFSTKKKIKEAHENDIKKLIVFFFFVPRNKKIRGRTSSQAKIDQETTLCIIIYSRKKEASFMHKLLERLYFTHIITPSLFWCVNIFFTELGLIQISSLIFHFSKHPKCDINMF